MNPQVRLHIRRSWDLNSRLEREEEARHRAGQPPTPGDLDLLNTRSRSVHRSHMDAKLWVCCLDVPPVKNCLMDLPAPTCPRCGRPNRNQFKFRLPDMTVDGYSLDMAILDQGSKPYCSLYSSAIALLFSTKLKAVRKGSQLTVVLDMELFAHEFFQYFPHAPNEGVAVALVLAYLMQRGIPPKVRPGLLLQQPLPPPCPSTYFTIKYYFQVNPRDVLFITRLLASGYPLVGVVRSGRRMIVTTNGEVYYTTNKLKDPEYPLVVGPSSHAVAILGAGGPELKPVDPPCYEITYDIQDSWGTFVHPSEPLGFEGHGTPIGGKYKVWSSDVIAIYGVVV